MKIKRQHFGLSFCWNRERNSCSFPFSFSWWNKIMCKSFVLYVLVWWSVPCFVFVVVAAQNPLLIFVSCLSISYVLLQRPFFMLNLFSPFDEFLFLTFFAFSLSSIFSWFVFLPLSLLRNVMSLFSHFVGDYLSISATFRRILNSDDDKYSHEL